MSSMHIFIITSCGLEAYRCDDMSKKDKDHRDYDHCSMNRLFCFRKPVEPAAEEELEWDADGNAPRQSGKQEFKEKEHSESPIITDRK